ncbi:hypothetical protein BDN72DRAFT_847228 [Pluteus cervinus]|uniref:Uncharacterized protein n=1 Tax=Pluteus cervinus TaxID=181527 RepID=A0ACD3ADN2_9AGAR|nr:hypothetical protein BDN72DRAFT_847228 [Pluteus cervinus]
MRTNFFIAAIFFAVVSSAQARAVLPKQVADSIGDSGHIVVDCSRFPRTCHIEEGRSESSTDAAEDAERRPGLLSGLLGGGGRVKPPGGFGGVGGSAGISGSAGIRGSAGIGGGLGGAGGVGGSIGGSAGAGMRGSGGAVGGAGGSAGVSGSAGIDGSAGFGGAFKLGSVGDMVGGIVDGVLDPVLGDSAMY